MIQKNPRVKDKDTFEQYSIEHPNCELCGDWRIDPAHHINYKSHGGSDVNENLITLCRSCHNATHYNKKIWKPFLEHYKTTKLDKVTYQMIQEYLPAQRMEDQAILTNCLYKIFTKGQ